MALSTRKRTKRLPVASTKSFLGQVVSLTLLALLLAQTKGRLTTAQVRLLFRELGDTAEQIERILHDTEAIDEAAYACKDAASALFVGRGIGSAICYEGALKLKEISYLHAEAYAAGEMKHGPIALIDDGFPVIAVATESPVYDKLVSNLKECEARGALIVAIATEGDEEIKKIARHVIYVPKCATASRPLPQAFPCSCSLVLSRFCADATSTSRATSRKASRSSSGPVGSCRQNRSTSHRMRKGVSHFDLISTSYRQGWSNAESGCSFFSSALVHVPDSGSLHWGEQGSRTMGENDNARKGGMARATSKEKAEALLASVSAGVDGTVGSGVSIVKVVRMKAVLSRTPSFARKVFSAEECAFCERHALPEVPFALRFAAKSAVARALGIEREDGMGVRDVEVRLSSKGRPFVVLSEWRGVLRRSRVSSTCPFRSRSRILMPSRARLPSRAIRSVRLQSASTRSKSLPASSKRRERCWTKWADRLSRRKRMPCARKARLPAKTKGRMRFRARGAARMRKAEGASGIAPAREGGQRYEAIRTGRTGGFAAVS